MRLAQASVTSVVCFMLELPLMTSINMRPEPVSAPVLGQAAQEVALLRHKVERQKQEPEAWSGRAVVECFRH